MYIKQLILLADRPLNYTEVLLPTFYRKKNIQIYNYIKEIVQVKA